MTDGGSAERALTVERVSVAVDTVTGAGRRAVPVRITVLDDVTMRVASGECVGIVGDDVEAARALVRVAGGVLRPTSGSISTGERDRAPRTTQTLLHDAEQAVDEGTTVEQLVGWLEAGLSRTDAMERRSRTLDVLVTVGLDPESVDQPVHELPLADQRRVLLARAAAAAPDVLILEDVTRGLGPTDRGQLMDVVSDLRRDLVPTIILSDPDVAFVAGLADRLAILHHARLVELGPTLEMVGSPAHPYTDALFRSLPVPRPRSLARDRPRPSVTLPTEQPPPGCRFHPRCRRADGRCSAERPRLEPTEGHDQRHLVACFHPLT